MYKPCVDFSVQQYTIRYLSISAFKDCDTVSSPDEMLAAYILQCPQGTVIYLADSAYQFLIHPSVFKCITKQTTDMFYAMYNPKGRQIDFYHSDPYNALMLLEKLMQKHNPGIVIADHLMRTLLRQYGRQ